MEGPQRVAPHGLNLTLHIDFVVSHEMTSPPDRNPTFTPVQVLQYVNSMSENTFITLLAIRKDISNEKKSLPLMNDDTSVSCLTGEIPKAHISLIY